MEIEVPEYLLQGLGLPQNLQPGNIVLITAASSSVGLAASQVVKHYGGIAIGTTTRPEKVEMLQAMPEARYDHIIVTPDGQSWYREAKKLTGGKGFNVIFDAIAAGEFLNTEIRLLANKGTLWIYGLLGQPGTVNVHPLIRKMASLRGWLLNELSGSGIERGAYKHVLERIADGTYQLPIAATFPLSQVAKAQTMMEAGQHIGKVILVP